MGISGVMAADTPSRRRPEHRVRFPDWNRPWKAPLSPRRGSVSPVADSAGALPCKPRLGQNRAFCDLHRNILIRFGPAYLLIRFLNPQTSPRYCLAWRQLPS